MIRKSDASPSKSPKKTLNFHQEENDSDDDDDFGKVVKNVKFDNIDSHT